MKSQYEKLIEQLLDIDFKSLSDENLSAHRLAAERLYLQYDRFAETHITDNMRIARDNAVRRLNATSREISRRMGDSPFV